MPCHKWWSEIRSWSKLGPLVAAILAPLSTLLDIPALSESWFKDDLNNPIKDPHTCVALSATGLAFNVVANLSLLVRYSGTTSEAIWGWATRLSVLCWWAKVGLALANVSAFGLPRPGTIRGEGFWCAVASLALCSMISIVLSFHWVFRVASSETDEALREAQVAVRISGRHFMLSVTFFVIDVCLFALVTSQIEGWSFFQGIYFSIITFLTIGFGDYHPTKTTTRVLICPFAIIGVAQLANIVSMHVSFFSQRASEGRARNRAEYDARRQKQLEAKDCIISDGTPDGIVARRSDLIKEFEYLDEHRKSEDRNNQFRKIGLSIGGMVFFWLVGAAIFSQLEGWGYGVGLYFCFVVFLTIGYGDFAPVTPGGRVMFILYALVAVPVMASFAVQAIVHIFTTISDRRLLRRQVKQAQRLGRLNSEGGRQSDEEKAHSTLHVAGGGISDHPRHPRSFTPHSEFVTHFHREWDEKQAMEAEDTQLARRLIELALAIERRSRKLLIAHLGNGSAAKMLLLADRNVQLREMHAIRRRGTLGRERESDHSGLGNASGVGVALSGILAEDHNAMQMPLASMSDVETLEEVEHYRKDFAGLLAAGSRLMKLGGEERALFEKRWEALTGAEVVGDV